MNVELLSNFDLMKFAKKLKIPLIDVVSKDLLYKMKPQIGCYIINLQNLNDGNGTHWTCFILKKNICIYYDSFGLLPPIPVINFANKFNRKMELIYSVDMIQNINSVLCGWFVLFFLFFISVKHKHSRNYKYLVNIHNNLFNKNNTLQNDIILQQYVKSIFHL